MLHDAAAQGRRALYVCFNRPLADHLTIGWHLRGPRYADQAAARAEYGRQPPPAKSDELVPVRRGIGIRFNGNERTDVEEYCISEGWIRVAVGRTVDRKGNPLTIKLTGKVEPYKAGFGPYPAEVYHAPFPIAYHGVSVADSLAAIDHLFKYDIEQPVSVARGRASPSRTFSVVSVSRARPVSRS